MENIPFRLYRAYQGGTEPDDKECVDWMQINLEAVNTNE